MPFASKFGPSICGQVMVDSTVQFALSFPPPSAMLHRAFLLYSCLSVVASANGMTMAIPTGQAQGLSNLLVRINLDQRASLAARQTGGGTAIPQVPPECQSICDPVNTIISAVSSPNPHFYLAWSIELGPRRAAHLRVAARLLLKRHISIASYALEKLWP